MGMAVVATMVALAGLVVPVGVVLVARQGVANAADAAALAAADAASGAIGGYPCDVADVAAGLNAATVTGCELDGLVASVTVSRTVLGFAIASSARAGPSP
ncbi:secretion/DNA translocation related TadE-like protein [Compostimonas suwonensis]|uniref:Secretion/DNA translocation related TadE-like protein n=2 Tax=Compostimonas suwonensis TaxID=1048394 RepID=A0A2M9BBW5_9MICO|nr:secretion/DNA translocation related TadE-like protein [Compostimonas suwonensis]